MHLRKCETMLNVKKTNMTKALNSGSASSHEPRLVGDILTEMFSSNSPFARGYRQHQPVYPNTEPCVDIKLLTREPGRIPIGKYLDGAITRDADDHFLFIENATDKKRNDVQQRNPHVYEGVYININRKPDGTLYPTFNRPQFNEQFTCIEFCRRAAEELIQVASGFAYNLEEEKPT